MSGVSGAARRQRQNFRVNLVPSEASQKRYEKLAREARKQRKLLAAAVDRSREEKLKLEQAKRDEARAREEYSRLMALWRQEISPKSDASNLQRTDPEREYWKPDTALRIGDGYDTVPDELGDFKEYQGKLLGEQYEQPELEFGDRAPDPQPMPTLPELYARHLPPSGGLLGPPGFGMLAVTQENVDDERKK